MLWIALGPLASAASAQESEEPLVLRIVALEHREASDALAQVEDLLSDRGTVELQPRDNTLVVRDIESVARLVVLRVRQFDRPPQRIRLDLQIVRAGTEVSGQQDLPPQLARRLRELLRFDSFQLLARAGLEMREGERVSYQFGDDYQVEFALGSVTEMRQVRLQDFRVRRTPLEDTRPLIHTHLNLTLERPMVLGLAQTEASERALMVVLDSRLLEEGAR